LTIYLSGPAPCLKTNTEHYPLSHQETGLIKLDLSSDQFAGSVRLSHTVF
jgi:hypothetical protein